ncbi:MAG: adenylosuccinate lyase [Planctomycetes bacterium]|nr:adenylosuccinate lyase [Planctomycetota bacterium]
MGDYQQYDNPLVTRYASGEMSAAFSPQRKHSTWRRLWLALAEGEQELGLAITDEQLAELRAHLDDIDFPLAEKLEAELRHDVMAHIHALAALCPTAKPIIHLGATSCYVTDNADLLIMRDALGLLRAKLVNLIDALARFAREHRALVTLGFTHFQPAQPTTVGKRASLWLYDFVLDYQEVVRVADWLPFRGVKGTTGTQDSFLELFEGSHAKVRKLDALVARKMGFKATVPVCGQTYSRKIDTMVLNALVGIAQSAAKMSNDLRLLQHLQEVEEPFGKSQIGSSAMPHKRNPMRCERMGSLARHLIATALSAPLTAATQWLERTLDDSAGRRIAIPEAFLAADAILLIALNVARGLVVHPKVIAARLRREAPFMATERLLMAAVKAGGDRQKLHERLRQHAWEARRRMTDEGLESDLVERLEVDEAFAAVRSRIADLAGGERLAGRAPQQVDEFLRRVVQPILKREAKLLGIESKLSR